MKVAQLKQVIEHTAKMHQDIGSADIAESLRDFSKLCVGRESMAVGSFAKLIQKAMSLPPASH